MSISIVIAVRLQHMHGIMRINSNVKTRSNADYSIPQYPPLAAQHVISQNKC